MEIRAKRHRGESDDGIWATEDTNGNGTIEEEEGILKANAAMLGGWESCKVFPFALREAYDHSVAYHKLELETDSASAKMVIHLLKVRRSS
jgi:hypothetical protein